MGLMADLERKRKQQKSRENWTAIIVASLFAILAVILAVISLL